MKWLRILYEKIFPRKLRTFKTTVIDKKAKSNAIIAGLGTLWIPSTALYLLLESGGQVKVNKRTFNRIRIGDVVWVSEYSNGSYRLHYS